MNDYYTYRELLAALKSLTAEQLDMTVTICDHETEELYPLQYTSISDAIVISNKEDRLDDNHPILVIKSEESN